MSTLTRLESLIDAERVDPTFNGSVDIVFTTIGGMRFPGRLDFRDGLCVRAEMTKVGDWKQPDGSPLDRLQFLLDLGDEGRRAIAIQDGRLVRIEDPERPPSKREFLQNFEAAASWFGPIQGAADSAKVDSGWIQRSLNQADAWLTPKAVENFHPDDFPELGVARLKDLESAVQGFLMAAERVPPDRLATGEEPEAAREEFQKLFDILRPYLTLTPEAREVRQAVQTVRFPEWVSYWIEELSSDADGTPTVGVDLFVKDQDEQTIPADRLGRESRALTDKVRRALDDAGIDRRPYLRMKSAPTHQTATR